MRVLVNTLPIGSLSGRHVVYGFLRQLAKWTGEEHEWVVLHRHAVPPPLDLDGHRMQHLAVTDRTGNWLLRSAWERWGLQRLVRRQGIDLVFDVSGAIVPGCPVPQVSLAQNPWCFIAQAQGGVLAKWKAGLQRRAYRHAFSHAVWMFFISGYLRELYRRHANGAPETQTDVAWVGVDDSVHQATERIGSEVERDPRLIVSVSAMAPWKGTETVVNALAILRARGIPARLRLIGPWPDRRYERRIRRQIGDLGLDDSVTITGHVSRDELHRHYAEARIFCLMSCCESFGIPAAEGQVFGTPVVSCAHTGIAEICRGGGLFGPAGDPRWTAGALETMLANDRAWAAWSEAASANGRRLRWQRCARPLMQMFSL